jgi:hypothetical protein
MLTIVRRRIRIAFGSRPVCIMDRNLLVALAHFPDRGHAIEELARTNEEFCSLCTDLAEAKAALLRWERSSSPVKETRTLEYRGLMDELAAEVEATLNRYR